MTLYTVRLTRAELDDLIGALGQAAMNLAAGPDFECISRALIKLQQIKLDGPMRWPGNE